MTRPYLIHLDVTAADLRAVLSGLSLEAAHWMARARNYKAGGEPYIKAVCRMREAQDARERIAKSTMGLNPLARRG